MNKKYKYAVIIGRFQPFHMGHYELFKQAEEVADNIICLIGSAGQAPNSNNPFTWPQRMGFIDNSLSELNFSLRKKVKYLPLNDHPYDSDGWLEEVKELVGDLKGCATDDEIILIGHRKLSDDVENQWFWFSRFPQWDLKVSEKTVVVDDIHNPQAEMSASAIRSAAYSQNPERALVMSKNMTHCVSEFMFSYWERKGHHDGFWPFSDAKECYDFHAEYPKRWGHGPHVTCDAAVFCMNHILLIERKNTPGKGLWALPGGHLDLLEYIEEGIIRELYEETGIDIPASVLRQSMEKVEVFQYPQRSMRGRIITHCGLICLQNRSSGTLPKVMGADDASSARWIPVRDVVESYRHKMFEDHYDMVLRMKTMVNSGWL